MKVFIRTNGYDESKQHYSNVVQLGFNPATNHSPTLCKYAVQIVKHLFKPGYEYYKAGIILSRLQPQDELQFQLINPIDPQKRSKNNQAMQAIDQVNARWGSESIKLARQVTSREEHPWRMKQFHKTPAYTTAWSDLKEIAYYNI
jgi:DNA polymerase V